MLTVLGITEMNLDTVGVVISIADVVFIILFLTHGYLE